jgi:dienelactone hydrolase
MLRWRPLVLVLLAGPWVTPGRAAESAAGGFDPKVAVTGPTRLDWKFVAAGFGPNADHVPAGYESPNQRYQLFVPAGYSRTRAWPLVVFLAPGDDPLGWRHWQKPCEDAGALFCAAYGAGSKVPPGQRVRIVLDMLDDVRRHYHVDPDQTYLTGFGGGGRLACALAFALPEYFGGVAPVCGTGPLSDMAYLGSMAYLGDLAYLRHRARDRLSVALVTGADDPNRREDEDYLRPLCQAVGVRCRRPLCQAVGVRCELWVVPKAGHAMPGPELLAEVYRWLAADLKRRQEDRRAYPGLAVGPDKAPTPLEQGTGLVETAEADLRRPESTWEAVALLQGVVARWGRTRPLLGDRARQLLADIRADRDRRARAAEQEGAEERPLLLAEAEAQERLNDPAAALQAWKTLLKHHPKTPDGEKAAAAVRRLGRTPYLGLRFDGDTTTINQVAPLGPAATAGLRAGDAVTKVGRTSVASAPEVRRILKGRDAGDKVVVEVRRDGNTVILPLTLGALPGADQLP